MATAIRRSSLTDQATQALMTYITENGLGDGDPLPGTGELAATFEVSVPVIREAIAGLAAIGVLKRQQGRESVVSTPNASHLSRLLSFRVAHAAVDDESIQQFREVVEVGSARLAAANRDEHALAELDRALQDLRGAEGDEALHVADIAFHAALARASSNDMFSLTLDALQPLLHRLRRRVWSGWVDSGGDLVSIVEAHATILEQVRAGDIEGAGKAMADHLAQARHGLENPPRPAAD
ncbi:FadR family transcriptional regulator [Streptomyces sp. 110]|uniref:FadR family transcriptional regulator n=1 Tax=Streptomyces endocoffeicus TaxID=2898945 RepID=A0ABS1Q8S5_9ACTN|nr:FCD domain-containing protein [Streptomyces endocoffeicus]MBL1120765.1 FadR family transcriptional regulator [Streptomyces endocoffeicus]